MNMNREYLQKHARVFREALRRGDVVASEGGILFIKEGALAKGTYFTSVNGGPEEVMPNLLPEQGLTDILAVAFGSTAKRPAWYLALYAGAVSPADGWTAANFAANSSEITSNTEGYSQTTRPQWTPGAAAAKAIDNLASKAHFTIACTTSVVINGVGLLSDNVKGGTSGVLASSGRYPVARTQYNGDDFQVGYRIALTS